MQRLINIMTVMLVISGCQMGLSAINKDPSRFQSVIACAQALTLDGSTNSTPNAPARKYKRSECPECHGKGYIMSGDGLFKQNCPYCEPDNSELIKGKNVSYCNRRDCPCEDCICAPNKCQCKVKNECNKNRVMCGADCVCENGKCKCQNPKDCLNISASEINSNGCCADCICAKGQCRCKYPGECLVNRNGGRSVKICDGNSCRLYQPQKPPQNATKALNSTSNAKTTINQGKTQQAKKGSSTYIYSNGSRCTTGSCGSGGWGTGSGGGRRLGFGGRGIF